MLAVIAAAGVAAPVAHLHELKFEAVASFSLQLILYFSNRGTCTRIFLLKIKKILILMEAKCINF